MKLKDIILIVINLAILGTIIATAVYIFQIGNGTRAIKCASIEPFGNSNISSAVTLGDGSRVKAYRATGTSSNFDKLPIFKFGDLAKRAQEYAKAYPNDKVYLDFAIYQLKCGLWIGVDPSHSNYAAVKWDNCAGKAPLSGADKLIYTLVTAAQAGVNVRILYQNPTEDGVWNKWGNGDGLYTYLLKDHTFLETLGANKGNGTLQVRRPFWIDAYDPGQMHNKFMTVSHYKGDSGDPNYLHTVYTSTSNCKDEDRVQSGIMVNGNNGLYNSYRAYFDLMWENSVAIEDLEYDEFPGDTEFTTSASGTDSTRNSAKTILTTTQYFNNFQAAVKACHDNDSNCSCKCSFPEPYTCIYSDCCGGECKSDCSSPSGAGSEYCHACIKKGNTCTTNTDCCSNSCVNGSCADNPGGPSGLNYVGEFISAFFYPMSDGACTVEGVKNAWSKDQNAVVRIADSMSLGPTNCEWNNICYKWNTGSDEFSAALLDKLTLAQTNGCTNTSAIQSDCCDPGIWSVFPGSIRSKSSGPYIHAKDFSLQESGNYTTISGSTNVKYYGVCSKGNNQILVKDKTIFDFFRETARIAGAP